MLEIWANIEDDAEIISVEVIELLERVQAGMDGMVVAEEGEGGGNSVETVEEEAAAKEATIFSIFFELEGGIHKMKLYGKIYPSAFGEGIDRKLSIGSGAPDY